MLTYFWVHDALQGQISYEAEVGTRSTVQWCGYLRKLCASEVKRNKRPLGGRALTVYLDETHLAKRRPAVAGGRPAEKAVWAFGGLDKATGRMFIEITADRTAAVLRKFIIENVAPGSVILTDAYPSYKGIESWGQGYVHGVVNHEIEFTSVTGVCTNPLEGQWGNFKQHLHKSKGLARHLLADYAGEWLWKRQHARESRFGALMATIKNDPRYNVNPDGSTPRTRG